MRFFDQIQMKINAALTCPVLAASVLVVSAPSAYAVEEEETEWSELRFLIKFK